MTAGYSLAQGTYPQYNRVKDAWRKVENKTLGSLKSARVKGKSQDHSFENGESFVPKCDLESTTSGNELLKNLMVF